MEVPRQRATNTQLALEEVLWPPWTATSLRWHRYEDENGVAFDVDRRDTFLDANIQRSFIYKHVGEADRTLYKVVTANHPRAGDLFMTIDYSPEEAFERTITGCRCLVIAVTYTQPPRPPTLAELIGPPPKGVAPLDQFCEVLLLEAEALRKPHSSSTLKKSAKLVHIYLGECNCGRQILTMVERGG